jgi:hypothetical protein
MAIQAELVTSEGIPVIVRRAIGDDAERLRRTARRLELATHPGVVPVVSSSGDEDRWELRMAYGGRPVELAGSLTAQQVAIAVASVAATLADLHAAGIVHGRLNGSRVLVGAHRRPLLCGFGDGLHGANPEDDVAALGRLVTELLGSRPVEARPWRRTRDDNLRRSLLRLADRACAEPPSRRPTARGLAASLAAAAPSASGGRMGDGRPPRHLRARGGLEQFRHPAVRVLACLVALAAAMAASAALSTGTTRERVRSRTATDRSSEQAATSVVGSRVRGPGQAEGSPVPCPDPCDAVSVRETMVRVGGATFEVGRPGDRVVVGDWSCTGAPQPAVLRPSTGEVFVFPGWAGEHDVTVTATTTVAGGRDLVVEHGTGACPRLGVVGRDGTVTPLPPAGRS